MNGYELRSKNTSKSCPTGAIRQSNFCGDFIIIGQTTRRNNAGYCYFLCEFLKTGTLTEVSRSNLQKGVVYDCYYPRVYNVGFFGEGIYSSTTHVKEYTLWNNMLKRCYSEVSLKRRPTYIDCSVDPRWHNFQNFCEDIQHLEGYAEWKANTIPKKYDLDKDIKIKGNKEYNIDTCIFAKSSDNSAESCVRTKVTGKTYLGVNVKTKESVVFYNQREFGRNHLKNAKQPRGMNNHIQKGTLYDKVWRIYDITYVL